MNESRCSKTTVVETKGKSEKPKEGNQTKTPEKPAHTRFEGAFKAVLSDAKVWRAIIEAISALVDQATFVATPTALKLRAMDPIRVAMLDLEMPKDMFEEYSVSSDFRMGVNLEELAKIMRRASSDDSVELNFDKTNNKLLVRFRGKSMRTFSISLLDLGTDDLPTPRVEYNSAAKITTDALSEAIKDAGVVSDQVSISIEKDNLLLAASGDTGDVLVELKKGSESLLDVEAKEQSTAIYALNYLGDMMKASAICAAATIELSTNMPLRLTYPMSPSGRITYFLAPRREPE